MKWTAYLLMLLSTAASTVGQQRPQSQSVPTFTSRTELVTVPVVVLRHGEHVPGLTKDEFEIEEDGQHKQLASFEEIGSSSSSSMKILTPPPGVYTNEVVSEGPIAVTVILLDLINTPYIYQENAKKTLLQYLQRDYRGERPTMLAILHPNGLRVLHDFTGDPQLLKKIVQSLTNRIKHDPSLDNQVQTLRDNAISQIPDITKEYAAIEKEFMRDLKGNALYKQQQASDSLEATFYQLQQLSRALSAVRGMKSLVWLFGGITLPSSINFRAQKTLDQYASTLKILSAAGIAVYPIDTMMESVNPGYTPPQSMNPRPSAIPLVGPVQAVQNFMDISQSTGGDYCMLRKDPDGCFRKATDYGSRYYLLSYYAKPSDSVRWRKIHVKVHSKGVDVRARNGFFSGGAIGDPDQRRKRDIAQAFASPIEYRGLPISARWIVPSEKASGANAGSTAPPLDPNLQHRQKRSFVLGIAADALTVEATDNNHIKLDIVAVAVDLNGKILADLTQQVEMHPSVPELEQMRAKGFAYTNEVMVPARTAKVRFIVRDDLSERIGTLSAAVEAQP